MTKKSLTYAFVFARGGSKRLPRKNLRLLAGKPLLAHSISVAKQCSLIDRVFVSTDDAEIAKCARDHGAEIPFMRPPELASDRASEWLAWRHAIQEVGATAFDTFVSLPATSPLRAVEDVERCIRRLWETDADIVLTGSPARRNPFFNMVWRQQGGFYERVCRPEKVIARSQDTPPIFDVTTVAYVTRPQFVLSADHLFAGKVELVEVPAERAADIDTEFDFKLAELQLEMRQPADD
jgi:N,N'-diacetyl-8-epilegionaminate cytidylyltransferase